MKLLSKQKRVNMPCWKEHSVGPTVCSTVCFTVWTHVFPQRGHTVHTVKTLEFNTVKYTPHCEQSPHCETPTVDHSVDTLALYSEVGFNLHQRHVLRNAV